MKLPHADFSVLGLGIKWRGGFWALGFGVRMRGESSGMSRAGHGEVREWLGERDESDLNDVGPKNDLLRLDRSDRLPVPVRPVRPRLTGDVLVLCFAV